MNIKEEAKKFAIMAHTGQVRKSEPDKPMIMHPISVGNLLASYGYSDEVVAAGYLHDVVEDTPYTIEDIKAKFGPYIASLVMGASESDKSLSWEERKQHTIDTTKHLPLENKLVICADKINNLEDMLIKFQKDGQKDFSCFKRGEKQQEWYYTNVYLSLIYCEDKNNALFKRLKEVITILFYGKTNEFLKDIIFEENQEYYENLKKIHAQKLELQHLKSLVTLTKPFVIEFSGTPRTGKTTIINNLYDFFKKGGFDISIIQEFTTSSYYKSCDFTSKEFRYQFIMEQVYKQLVGEINKKQDIILIDRSINDRQIWNHRGFIKQDLSQEYYKEAKEKYSTFSKELIDFLVLTYTDALTAIKRDYNSSLAIEPRSFLNVDNVEEYNNSLLELKDLFNTSVENHLLLDTTNTSTNDNCISIANEVMPIMRKKYIDSFKTKYNIK